MKDNWERSYPFVRLDLPTLTELAQPLWPGRAVVHADLLTAGLANTNYKVMVSGYDTPFVIRVYTRDSAACRKEVDIYNLIHDRVPLPDILYADVDGRRYERPYAITSWVDGVMLDRALAHGSAEDVASVAHATGAVLATIGSYTFARAGFFGPHLAVDHPLGDADTSWLPYIRDRLFQGPAEGRLGVALRDHLWNMVTQGASAVRTVNDARSLVHADYNGSNIIVRREGESWVVGAVLDWEFAFAGSPLHDVGNMLRGADTLPPAFEAAFIRGFEDGGGGLPRDWKNIAALLDLVNLCEFLNAPDPRGTRVADVVRLIRTTVERWEANGRKVLVEL